MKKAKKQELPPLEKEPEKDPKKPTPEKKVEDKAASEDAVKTVDAKKVEDKAAPEDAEKPVPEKPPKEVDEPVKKDQPEKEAQIQTPEKKPKRGAFWRKKPDKPKKAEPEKAVQETAVQKKEVLKKIREQQEVAKTPQGKKESVISRHKRKKRAREKAKQAHTRTKKPGRRRLTRKSLEEYLEKAGYSVPAAKVKRASFYGCLAAFIIVTVGILVVASANGAAAWDVLFFFLALWTAVFAGVLLLIYMGVFFFLDYIIYKRTRELEEVLPDFLQLASSNIAAGMSVDKALWYSIRPNFGVLAREMQEVAKATMTGEDLEQSLVNFAEKYDSKMLQRSVSILIEGLHAGGEMADLLNKISINLEEIKIMKKEMAANVTTYAIFITFASIIIAPFLFALATELLEIIVQITQSIDLNASSQLFTLQAADPRIVKNFKTFSILTVFISTIFATSIVSVIRRGNIMEGIKMIPVYGIVAVLIYYFALGMLRTMFGGLV